LARRRMQILRAPIFLARGVVFTAYTRAETHAHYADAFRRTYAGE
jgi:hypothetical protein